MREGECKSSRHQQPTDKWKLLLFHGFHWPRWSILDWVMIFLYDWWDWCSIMFRISFHIVHHPTWIVTVQLFSSRHVTRKVYLIPMQNFRVGKDGRRVISGNKKWSRFKRNSCCRHTTLSSHDIITQLIFSLSPKTRLNCPRNKVLGCCPVHDSRVYERRFNPL